MGCQLQQSGAEIPDRPPKLRVGFSSRLDRLAQWLCSLPAAPVTFGGWLLVLGVVRLGETLQVAAPLCMMRVVTGIPCPTCGGTRCLAAWSYFDLADAFRFNPLVALGCLGICGWFTVWLLDCWSGKEWAKLIGQQALRIRWLVVLIAAAVVNWIYLVLYLPK